MRLWGPSYVWGRRLAQAWARLTAQGCLSLPLKQAQRSPRGQADALTLLEPGLLALEPADKTAYHPLGQEGLPPLPPASTPSSPRGPGVIFNSAELPAQKVDKAGSIAAFLSPPPGVQAFWGDWSFLTLEGKQHSIPQVDTHRSHTDPQGSDTRLVQILTRSWAGAGTSAHQHAGHTDSEDMQTDMHSALPQTPNPGDTQHTGRHTPTDAKDHQLGGMEDPQVTSKD